jgi:transposase-like protein
MTQEEFPHLSKEEYRYIRVMAGISMQELANRFGIGSRSTISNWELYQEGDMRPYQTKMLKESVSPDVFNECRRLWKEKKEKELLAKQTVKHYGGFTSR